MDASVIKASNITDRECSDAVYIIFVLYFECLCIGVKVEDVGQNPRPVLVAAEEFSGDLLPQRLFN